MIVIDYKISVTKIPNNYFTYENKVLYTNKFSEVENFSEKNFIVKIKHSLCLNAHIYF